MQKGKVKLLIFFWAYMDINSFFEVAEVQIGFINLSLSVRELRISVRTSKGTVIDLVYLDCSLHLTLENLVGRFGFAKIFLPLNDLLLFLLPFYYFFSFLIEANSSLLLYLQGKF